MPVRLGTFTRQLLDTRTFAVLATSSAGGGPQLSVMWITRDDDDVLLSTITSRVKFANLTRDPRVSVLLYDPDNPYRYAEIRGRASLTEEGGRELIDALARKYEGRDFGSEPEGTVRVVIRVTPDRVVEHGA